MMLPRVNLPALSLLACFVVSGSSGCGDDGGGISTGSMRDSGVDDGGGASGGDGDGDGDGDQEPPFGIPDAGDAFPGDPPAELAGQSCAADTNKVYTLASTVGSTPPAELAVDLIESTFRTAFVSTDGTCGSAITIADLYGAPGELTPSAEIGYDGCSLIERVALTRTATDWLVAIVDNREGARDLWVQALGGNVPTAYRITENMATETSVALHAIDAERNVIVWTEASFFGTTNSLHLRMLSASGEPIADEVVLDESDVLSWHGLRLAVLYALDLTAGEARPNVLALAYRRDETIPGAAATTQSAVLDVLDLETAERVRDPWVLTAEAGLEGTVDVVGDENGAGVAYTFVQGTSRQVWFQQLGPNGEAARTTSGLNTGGPIEASRIVGTPDLGVDISLAKLPRGFALGYRALRSVGVPAPMVRVFFLDRSGRIIGDSGIALASETGGQTAIEVAYDGRIVLSWVDTDAEGTSSLRALILPCGG